MKRLKYFTAVIFMLFIQYGFTRANTKDTVLTGYLKMAAQNNPGLKASFNEYLASLEKVPQAGSLPDPEGAMGFFLQPMELMTGNQIGNISVMQMFPWFGTLKAAKDEAALMAKAKYQQFEENKAELFYNVKASWFQLARFNQEIRLMQENISLLQTLEKLALTRFQSPGSGSGSQSMPAQPMDQGRSGNGGMSQSSGMNMNKQPQTPSKPQQSNTPMPSAPGVTMGGKQSGLSDVLRVRMEILDQERELALLKDRMNTEISNFNSMLNRDQGSEVILPDSIGMVLLPVPPGMVADSILANNPMLGMYEAEGKSFAAMAEKSKKMGLPMLGFGLNYMIIQEQIGNSSMMNGKDMVMPMFNFTIPIYRKKYKSMRKEAELLKEAAKNRSSELKNTLTVQYNQLIQDMNDAQRRIGLYREQADLAKRTTDLLVSGFTSGNADFDELLRMQYKVLDYRYKDVEAITDYNTSVARAERLMNSTKF